MADRRVQEAAVLTGFSGDRRQLKEALDVTRHLPLALVGNKVLDLILTLAYYHADYDNGEFPIPIHS